MDFFKDNYKCYSEGLDNRIMNINTKYGIKGI